MYHYIYKITNNINGKFYIGKRSYSGELPDPYMGSGTALKAAMKKYGKENFSKVILGSCSTLEQLNMLERLEVTDDLVNDPNCYNLMVGGHGGRQGKEARKKISESKMGDKNPMRNKKWTEAERKVKRNARTKNEQQRKNNWYNTRIENSEVYIVTHPCGKEEEIYLLTPFCNKHKLCQRTMKAIAHKTHLKDRKNIPTKHKKFTIRIKPA